MKRREAHVWRRRMGRNCGAAAHSGAAGTGGDAGGLHDTHCAIEAGDHSGKDGEDDGIQWALPELIRLREGQQVIDVVNETDMADIVHWHGLEIPSLQDGATEEGSPELAAHGGRQRYTWMARPAGFRWYHSHMTAGHHLDRATYSGEFGFLMIDAKSDPARYDQEIFLALHDWEGHAEGSSEGYQEVVYSYSTINDRMLGFGEPLLVRDSGCYCIS